MSWSRGRMRGDLSDAGLLVQRLTIEPSKERAEVMWHRRHDTTNSHRGG